jgi:myo-inositol-1(or 4)-monophosphatase
MLGVVSLVFLYLLRKGQLIVTITRDVAAGICILREAGGLITSANPPANPETDPIEEVRLGSRLYLAIRPAGDTEHETGRQAQERVVRETWKRVSALDYSRPGA